MPLSWCFGIRACRALARGPRPSAAPHARRRRAAALPGLLLLLLCGAVSAQEIQLASGGETKYRIVLSRTASETERHAAGELAGYLERITGARFPVVERTGGSEPAIRLVREGSTLLGAEGFQIRTTEQGLEIVGGTGRGVLYGVYYFLERHLGVRWYAPDHTAVPERETLSLPTTVEDQQTPHFEYREVLAPVADDPAYAVRNRLNGLFGRPPGEVPAQWREALVPLQRLHIFDLVPPDRYRDDHPEYYGGGQLRFANADVQRIATEAALRQVRSRGMPGEDGAYVLIEHAGRDGFHSEGRDRALIDRHESSAAAYIDFVRRIAEAVAAEQENVTVLALAHGWSRKSPVGMELPDNMGILFSGLGGDRPPLEAEKSDPAGALTKDIEGWAGLTDQVFVRIPHGAGAGGQPPAPDRLGADMKALAEQPAVVGVISEGFPAAGTGEPAALWAWVAARLMWDPEQDVDTLVEDFAAGYYGRAAPAILEYVAMLRRADGRLPPSVSCLTGEQRRRADELLARARARVADDPLRLRHVREAREGMNRALSADASARSRCGVRLRRPEAAGAWRHGPVSAGRGYGIRRREHP